MLFHKFVMNRLKVLGLLRQSHIGQFPTRFAIWFQNLFPIKRTQNLSFISFIQLPFSDTILLIKLILFT